MYLKATNYDQEKMKIVNKNVMVRFINRQMMSSKKYITFMNMHTTLNDYIFAKNFEAWNLNLARLADVMKLKALN